MKQIEIASVHDAAISLGREKVVTSLDVTRFEENTKDVFYTGNTIQQLESCSDANEKGLANWFLVFHSGKSPKQILEKRFENFEFGFGMKNRFEKNFWFSSSNENWVNERERPGYYLLNFVGEEDEFRNLRFESMPFEAQEIKIEGLPQKCRAPLSVVMEAVFSIYDTHKILLLQKWNHLSSTRSFDGSLIYLGSTKSAASGEKIMNIFEFSKKYEDSAKDFHYYGMGVVLMMKKNI